VFGACLEIDEGRETVLSLSALVSCLERGSAVARTGASIVSQISSPPLKAALFVYNLNLFVDHSPGKPVDVIPEQMHPATYMEPSYLIWTCCDWIAPVAGSRLGLMNT
jgi:hypothetical protein